MSLADLHAERESLSATITRINDDLKTIKAKRDAVDAQILAFLQDNGMSYGVIEEKRYEVDNKMVPGKIEWEALYQWIEDNKAPFILQKRVYLTALTELIDGGQTVDGVELVELTKLRVVKR